MKSTTGGASPRHVVSDAARATEIAEILKAVAHPLRLRLVALLCEHEETVGGLGRALGAPQAIVSQQLRILRMHRLVDAIRGHGFVTYRLREPRLRDLVRCVESCGAQ